MPAPHEDARVPERRRSTRRLSLIDEFDRRIDDPTEAQRLRCLESLSSGAGPGFLILEEVGDTDPSYVQAAIGRDGPPDAAGYIVECRIYERIAGARTAPSEAYDHFRVIPPLDGEAAATPNDDVTCAEAYAAMRPFLTRGGLPDTAVWRSVKAEFRSDRDDGLV